MDGKVPAVCLYKEMDDALGQAKYRGLKLTEQAMKVIERIAYSLVRQVMTIDWGTLGGPLCRWHSHYCILHRLLTWKKGMERKGLSERGEDHNHDLLQRSGNFPCAICRTGVGSDTDACTRCTRSAVGSIAFKRAQTTGALHV